MNYKIKTLFAFYVILYSCAVQSPPSGGPADKENPYIKEISPKNGTIEIRKDQSIEILFNEMIDPKSVKSSIKIIPETELKISTYRKKIVIKPKEFWPKNIFRISVLRSVADFHGNTLDNTKNLFFNTSSEIPLGKISGKIFNYNDEKTTEIGLFKIDENLTLIAITENNYLNEFRFNNIPNGEYIVIGIAGEINNIYEDIRLYNYGISSNKIIVKDNHISDLRLNYSIPNYRKKIKSTKFKNKRYGVVQLDDGSEIILIDNQAFNQDFGLDENIIFFKNNELEDSVKINIQLKNNLEVYNLEHKIKLDSSIVDSIAPFITDFERINTELKIKFSEPVDIINNLKIFSSLSSDSNLVDLKYLINGPMSISLFNLSNSLNSITINNELIKDYSNNYLADSLLYIEPNDEIVVKRPKGNILGKVIYEGKNRIIVEAISKSGEKYRTEVNRYNEFSFSNLNVDEYIVWAYEDLNPINDYYYNGTINPISYSAKFNYFNELITIRANWDIEDIRIRIN